VPIFDTHCHLGLDGAVAPAEEHARAVAADVDALLVVGIDAATSAAARALAHLPGVRWSAGLHPNDATRFAAEWPAIAALRSEPPVRGVMHCFSGGVDEARQALDLGLHLSFAGPLTYPKNDALRAAAAFAPADRILVETDAPFLPPQRRRGQRNEPAYIVETLTALAVARGVDFAAAAAATYGNARALFDRR
jgi:Tat protein secretion system quality control protein TatD with DNase activity